MDKLSVYILPAKNSAQLLQKCCSTDMSLLQSVLPSFQYTSIPPPDVHWWALGTYEHLADVSEQSTEVVKLDYLSMLIS